MRRTCLTAAFALATALAAFPAGAQTSTPASAGAPAAKPASVPTTTPAAPTAAAPTVPATTTAAPAPRPAAATPPAAIATGITPPADYGVGVDDALDVVYWQDKDMSATVVVRPDGNISLPLLNDIKAAGLTPEQLRVAITENATKFVEGPTVSVVIKAINSRKIYVQGQV